MIRPLKSNKKSSPFFILFLLATILIGAESCKKAKSDIAKEMYSKNKNKVFKDVTPEGFSATFEKVIADEKSKLANPAIISAYYQQNEYDPELIMAHFANGDLKTMVGYFKNAKQHGLNPELFSAGEIDKLLTKLGDKKAIKTLDEAYHDMAELELLSANAMITYSNTMQFGIINPRKIYARYFTKTARPDSASMSRVFQVTNYKAYLDSIQPGSSEYKALQKAIADSVIAPGMTLQETQRTLKVNLERLRWKNKPTEGRYVIVNIPDFRLDVMDQHKSVLNMKVCVGEGRNKTNENSLVEYDDSDKIDRPFSRETPQLNSMIYVAEVNPVWNIPESIANKEIVVEAAKDPYYLSNKNIDVYKNDKKVEDPETIDWSNVGENSSYSFKQKPGDDNALGKVKFLFKNKSSVYLHDTPAKLAFNQSMRAVSHGCVRLEKPLDFAHALFGDGEKYNMIAKYMSEDNPTPTSIGLSNKVPVYITYVTAWPDEAGTLQVRPDVYGLDIVLFGHMTKYIW